MWYPLVKRVSVVYHPSPLEGRAIGALVREFGATVLVATPTFLRIYLRTVLPNDFGSLRYVVVGAEKLRDDLAEQFRETFGIRPVEGYGCTECSPVVSVNVPDFRARGIVQIGTKPGTIGQALPGIAVRIVDPDTRVPLDASIQCHMPVGQDGLLLVKGLSVMKGYLGKPEKTAEVLQDGWYDTGDIARVDADGFLTITDRLSRFSKIGGEMVPHLKVEDAIIEVLRDAVKSDEPLVAVTGVPDPQKGERLVVLHAKLPVPVEEVCERLKGSGLPNLWIPSREAFVQVEQIPILGTGKVDLKKLKAIAMERRNA
jgi:acyl-[acyl-carrier-protein]-phospholipid O-acyltransferase/long-chain-fatty-acid--[acyl-carrier-protein] ligase